MSISESDLGGFATTAEDAFSEEDWYTSNLDGYTSSGVPAPSAVDGILNYFRGPQTQPWVEPVPETVNPAYSGIGMVQYMQKAGFSPSLINAAGQGITEDRARNALIAEEEAKFNAIGTEVPGINYNVPTSPFDYSKPQAPSGLQFERITPTPEAKANISSIINQDYTGGVNPSNMYAYNTDGVDALGLRRNTATDAMDINPTGYHNPNSLEGFNTNMSAADQRSLDRGVFDVYPENAVIIDGKPMMRNEIGNVSPYQEGQYSDIEGNWMKAQGDTLGWRDEEMQAEQMFGGDKGIADFSGNLGFGDADSVKQKQALASVTPMIDLGTGGVMALGTWLGKQGFKDMAELGMKHGKEAVDWVKSKMFTPNLNKMADAPFKRDHVPTIKLDPLATRTKFNPVGKDKTWQEPLQAKGRPFDRRITKEDQTPNFLSNKAQRQARIDKGEVKTTSRPTGDPRAVEGYTFVPGQGKSVGAMFDKGAQQRMVKTPGGKNQYGQSQFGNQAQSNKAIAANRAKAAKAQGPARVTSTGPKQTTMADRVGTDIRKAVQSKDMSYEQAFEQVEAVMRGPFSEPGDYIDPREVKQVMDKLGIRKPGPTVYKKF